MYGSSLLTLNPQQRRGRSRNSRPSNASTPAKQVRGASASTAVSDAGASTRKRSSSRGSALRYRSWSSHSYADGNEAGSGSPRKRGVSQCDVVTAEELLTIESMAFGILPGSVRLDTFTAPRGQRSDSTIKGTNLLKSLSGGGSVGAVRVAPFLPGDPVIVSLGLGTATISLAQGNMDRIGDIAYGAIWHMEVLPQQLLKVYGRSSSFEVSFTVHDSQKLLMLYKMLCLKSKGIVMGEDTAYLSVKSTPRQAPTGAGSAEHTPPSQRGLESSRVLHVSENFGAARTDARPSESKHLDNHNAFVRTSSAYGNSPGRRSAVQPLLRHHQEAQQSLPPPTQMTALAKSKRIVRAATSTSKSTPSPNRQDHGHELQNVITTPRDQMIQSESEHLMDSMHADPSAEPLVGYRNVIISSAAQEAFHGCGSSNSSSSKFHDSDTQIQNELNQRPEHDERRERLRAQLVQLRTARLGNKISGLSSASCPPRDL